uniref:F-box domain-containing protein n=1 Tax=Glossina morsitans morsitans TaxID=37546 RepID=A0A1B0ETZ3_GLOMM
MMIWMCGDVNTTSLEVNNSEGTGKDVMDARINEKITATSLPNEMWLQVLSNLSHGDSLQAKLVCKRWCQLVDELRLKRKSKLIINGENLKRLYNLTEHQDLKYASVEIDDRANNTTNSSALDSGYLPNIFKCLGSNVVELKLYNLSILSALKNLLPNLKELNLSQCCSYQGKPMDLNTFSNLKSLSMPMNGDKQQSELLPSLTKVTGIRLEKLSITIEGNIDECLNVLAAQATSLRWLELSLSSRNLDLRWLHQLQETFNTYMKSYPLAFENPIQVLEELFRTYSKQFATFNGGSKYCDRRKDINPGKILTSIRKNWIIHQEAALKDLEIALRNEHKLNSVALAGPIGVGKSLVVTSLIANFPWPDNVHTYAWNTNRAPAIVSLKIVNDIPCGFQNMPTASSVTHFPVDMIPFQLTHVSSINA